VNRFKKDAGLVLVLLLCCSGTALAQSAPAVTQASPLPLSGRSSQNGSVATGQAAIPGTTTSVNTINPTVQVSGPYALSASSIGQIPFSGQLSLSEAIRRGLGYNLGAIGSTEAVRQAHGQSRVARSTLLPNLNGNLIETVKQADLAAQGIRLKSPGLAAALPTVVGPFNYFDLRATLTQNIVDLTAINNYRSANEILRANQLSAQDSRDLVVLAVGGAYLQVIAAKARVESARAQLETAKALYQQNLEQRGVGVVAQIDVNRSEVQMLTQQQRLTSLQNDFAKQKINLARLTGLPPTDQYEITDEVPFTGAPAMRVDEALQHAFAQRWDLRAAEAQVRAAERTRSAARAERLPSLDVSSDYGAIGTNPAQSHGTFTAVATLRFPIWRGGRTEGDIEEATASLAQRRAELEDAKAQIESDVRNAYLDLQAAASQVEVAQKNREVTRQSLALTRQRFEAGVTDNVEVVESEEAVASADLDYINAVFAHNLAKLSLARAMGRAEESLPNLLQ
jgi:outer membrane protein TolC